MNIPALIPSRNTRLVALAVWIVLDLVLLIWAGVCIGLGVFEQACMHSAGISTGLLGVSMVVKLVCGAWIVWRTSAPAPTQPRLTSPAQ
jgi:hypothetical protein